MPQSDALGKCMAAEACDGGRHGQRCDATTTKKCVVANATQPTWVSDAEQARATVKDTDVEECDAAWQIHFRQTVAAREGSPPDGRHSLRQRDTHQALARPECSAEHSRNALSPIVRTLSGITTASMPRCPKKAQAPMAVTGSR